MTVADKVKADIRLFLDEKKKETLSKKQKFAFEAHIASELKKLGGCNKCPRTDSLTLDHIVPSSVLRDFGVDIEREIIEDNYQILCRFCNQFKSGRLDFSNPQTKVVLMRLLEKI